MTSLICPVDNVVMHYKAEKLRLVGVSDVLPDIVTAVAADRSGVYAAAGTSVAVMKTCRHISRLIDVGARTKFMKILGDYLILFLSARLSDSLRAFRELLLRNDDKPFMTTADIGGDIVVWNLEKRQLVGKISNVHHAAVTELYFMPGEPVMVSASADNSLRTWVLDGGDGHVDQFNVQSGLHVKTFAKHSEQDGELSKKEKAKQQRAHEARITALVVDVRGSELITGCSSGRLKYWQVWELSTSQLIDVMLFDKPCIGLSFNNTGEYLATVHKGEKSIFIWANKKMYASHVNIRALPLDYLPTWKSHVPEIGVNTFVIDDESDDEWEGSEQIDESLVTYSGLAPSRWANLPDLALIKERNKPDQPARKPKQAPFFLTAAPTLEGFEFEVPQEDEDERRRTLQAKRSLLELESSFSSMLRA
ncbi:WD domain, G-beta repeat protein [Ancylostoma duodenale]|uniref:WD domain, G-beta repeat protein n=1 Tax=Ancylostoma duodenale TaxID=51022 RepID=A0A0C2CPS7_9BILA|nr:WD domain, G-beta repeat protein [Ancylostoma duodenale]